MGNAFIEAIVKYGLQYGGVGFLLAALMFLFWLREVATMRKTDIRAAKAEVDLGATAKAHTLEITDLKFYHMQEISEKNLQISTLTARLKALQEEQERNMEEHVSLHHTERQELISLTKDITELLTSTKGFIEALGERVRFLCDELPRRLR